jgi:aminoglycoside N3'-acetyltransferase
MEITKKRIVSDLRKIGLHEGDHVAVGVSFKSLGRVQGGPDGFIDALLEAVGPEGTLMMNTYTEFFYLTEIRLGWTDYVYDAGETRCNTGIISEKMRLRDDAIRSRHPTMSNAAIGKHAHFLLDDHDETADSFSPYSKLAEVNGKYLAIGIGDHLKGARHHAQHQAGLLTIVPWKRAVQYRDRQGRINTFILTDRGGCTTRLPDLVKDLREKGIVMEGKIGMARSITVPVKESLERMYSLLKGDPTINLCDKPLCLWCREIERRLNLYGNIKNPKIFQRNKAVIHLFALINRLRELDNRLTARFKLILKKRKTSH